MQCGPLVSEELRMCQGKSFGSWQWGEVVGKVFLFCSQRESWIKCSGPQSPGGVGASLGKVAVGVTGMACSVVLCTQFSHTTFKAVKESLRVSRVLGYWGIILLFSWFKIRSVENLGVNWEYHPLVPENLGVYTGMLFYFLWTWKENRKYSSVTFLNLVQKEKISSVPSIMNINYYVST